MSTALGLFAAASVVGLALGTAAAVIVERAGQRLLDRLGVPRREERCPVCQRVEVRQTTWGRVDA